MVFLIRAKRLDSRSSPSIIKVPPKILCRQCSELIWAKPNISESVNGRPFSFSILCRYSISSGLRAKPSSSLYFSMLSMRLIGSGSWLIVKIFWSRPLYMRWSMRSCSASSLLTGKYSSIRKMPLRLIFWVISTAFVLHGVIISRRGPMKKPSSFSSLRRVAPP